MRSIWRECSRCKAFRPVIGEIRRAFSFAKINVILMRRKNSEYLSSQLEKEEMAYRERFGITDKTHLYYQDFSVFGFPARIHNPLNKKGIRTVRDGMI